MDQHDARTIGRFQFSLGQLLTIVTISAFVMGVSRVSDRVLIPVLIGIALVLPTVWRPRCFFTWYLPAIWTCVARINFEYPGDEYGGFVVSSLAAMWIVWIVDFSAGQSPRDTLLPLMITGATTMAVVGALLDKLRVPWVPWSVLWVSFAIALFAWSFGSFESVERALSKNGSYEAYVLPSLNLGLYGATSVMLVGTGIWRLTSWSRGKS